MSAICIRFGRPEDAAELADLLNAIIVRGGTTAMEDPLDPVRFDDWFLTGPHVLLCTVAEDAGRLLGFQSLSDFYPLPPGWADIGTFTRQSPHRPGVGQALFAATRAAARARGIVTLNATIRADNSRGLTFYRRLGFQLYDTSPNQPLRDGTPMDRLHHRFDL